MIQFEQNPENEYVPFSNGNNNYQTYPQDYWNNNQQNEPFSVGGYNTKQTNGLEEFFNTAFTGGKGGHLKCEYCGKPAQHANCRAHKKWCPLSCDNLNSVPLGNDFVVLSCIILVYSLLKIFKKRCLNINKSLNNDLNLFNLI